MKKILGALMLFLFSLTAISAQNGGWKEMAVFDGKEVYIDTTTIIRNETEVSVWVKEVYTKEFEKDAYVSKIEKAMNKTASFKKSWDKKWSKKFSDLSYTLSRRVFNCVDSKFQTVEIIEYNSKGKKILKTIIKQGKAPWVSVEYDTIGDVLMFEVCDNY